MRQTYSMQEICGIVGGHFIQQGGAGRIEYLVTDSRTIPYSATSLFFALTTSRQDGHRYLEDAYEKGVRHFIVKEEPAQEIAGAGIIKVIDVLEALQSLAAHHRTLYSIPVIGITGSNGKTIVKEWLHHLLHPDHKIIRSPRSYNSQIGVPLSVWQLEEEHTLGIFEAGISKGGEMEKLEPIIRPTIGVLTNLGEAHSEGFISDDEKKEEKLKLFKRAEVVIGPHSLIYDLKKTQQILTWGDHSDADLVIRQCITLVKTTQLEMVYKGEPYNFALPFVDEASIHNCVTCISVLFYMGCQAGVIQERLSDLEAIDMRLQLKHGANNCTLINDTYSADLTSLTIALHFLAQQKTGQQRTVILSDFVETGKEESELYKSIAKQIESNEVGKVIAIGENISHHLPPYLPPIVNVASFATTEDFLDRMRTTQFINETILVKGARRAGFERIIQALETKVHQTRLEINLTALAHNLNEYKRLLSPGTKVMAMVKAFSYGSGTSEIASVLQFQKVDYLGVAYTDEGVALRKAGITLPIMVMNADELSFDALVTYNLQAVLYSFALLQQFHSFLQHQAIQHYPVHLEIETGMNRLGFDADTMLDLISFLAASESLKVESVFSHLAASEDAGEDTFTQEQWNIFQHAVTQLEAALPYSFISHIANSAAVIRHPHLQLDMVRLGIGLYGIEISTNDLQLQPVLTLLSTIAQLKYLKKGETVSYNRSGVVQRDSIIATVRIGYADGYSRRLGNGKGKMLVKNKLVPVIGKVCMDMTMIDVTDVPGVKEGDEVIIFGSAPKIEDVALWADTIPYEIMTSVSQRVKRVYYQE